MTKTITFKTVTPINSFLNDFVKTKEGKLTEIRKIVKINWVAKQLIFDEQIVDEKDLQEVLAPKIAFWKNQIVEA